MFCRTEWRGTEENKKERERKRKRERGKKTPMLGKQTANLPVVDISAILRFGGYAKYQKLERNWPDARDPTRSCW